jgi:hypothetical protein
MKDTTYNYSTIAAVVVSSYLCMGTGGEETGICPPQIFERKRSKLPNINTRN